MELGGVELNELEYENIGKWPVLIRILMIAGIFLVTLFVGYFYILSDDWDALNIIRSKRLELETTFESAQHKVANLDAYRQQVKLVEVELEKLTEQLPPTNEGAGLLEDISQQASSSGLQFVSIKPGEEQNKGFYVENSIQLTLSGTYHSVGEFVSSISSMPRIVTLHDFTIARVGAVGTPSIPLPGAASPTAAAADQPMRGPLVMTVIAKTYWTVANQKKVNK